jgi:Ca2+-binding EF-hand superfamily protein
MPLAVLLLALTARAAEPPVSPSTPILVTGHPWAPFISPMGEPFRAHGATDDTLADWFRQADRNGDGVVTTDEMVADAERFFATLDSNHDGQIDPDELTHYEWEVAPDIQVMARTRRAPGQPAPIALQSGEDHSHVRADRHRRDAEDETTLGIGGALQGAARYSLLDIPEPVAAADTDFDRAITIKEFKDAAMARFQLLDRAHTGKLTLAQLEGVRPVLSPEARRGKRKRDITDARIGEAVPPSP